jgi:hypothetical protein
MQIFRMRGLGLAVILTALGTSGLLGCTRNATALRARDSAVRAPGPLSLTLEVPVVATIGQPVPLRLTLTNTGSDTVMIGLPGVESQRADFVVSKGGKEVWSKLRGSTMLDVLLTGPLVPGEATTFNAIWTQRDNHGNRVAAGAYTVQGFLNESLASHSAGGIVSAPVEIRIR